MVSTLLSCCRFLLSALSTLMGNDYNDLRQSQGPPCDRTGLSEMSAETMIRATESQSSIAGHPQSAWIAAAFAGLFAIAACATAPQTDPAVPSPPPPQSGSSSGAGDNTSDIAQEFSTYLAGLKARARSAGYAQTVIDTTLQPVEERVNIASFIEDSRKLDQNQAEFSKQVWTYLDTAASPSRIATGQARASAQRATLSAIEAQFGVDSPYLVAIWGLESNFGSFIGNTDVPTALASLAFEGRRRAFFEKELFAVFDMLDSGAAERGDLIGGWAGAMGQTQFMPSTYLSYAVDFNQDGRMDIWKDEGDALASAANLLANRGWTKGEPWGMEVRLPNEFDYTLADGRSLTLAAWRAAGVEASSGAMAHDLLNRDARLLLPGGARGPAFLILPNFDVFRRYNHSTSYALAAGLLGDAIAGRPGISKPWPRDERALTVEEVKTMQNRLTALGFDTRGVDGVVGPKTRQALREWQTANDLIPDGFPTVAILSRLAA
jgi:membrane-bound lytic murein transglycosylase B